MTILDEASRDQVRAADPTRSTWLSANAGSGKTRVLTDRVALLLLGGADPQGILCLTYTKAAAGEMQNRLFQRLGEWAMLDDARLDAQLRKLGVEGEIRYDFARTLFAAAIETPGGLKIQTIHSFCSALLRRFPLEAGVSPRFTEMDETTDRQLRAEVAEALADGPQVAAVDAVARFCTGEDFEKLAAEVVRHAATFRAPRTDAEIWRDCGLPPGFSLQDLAGQVFTGGEDALLRALVASLATGKSTDVTAAEKLAPVARNGPTIDDLPMLESVFLFGAGANDPFGPRLERFPTKDLRESLPFLARLQAFMVRVAEARAFRIRLATAEKTRALRDFAAAFLPAYEARKRDRGWLSFDDLIERTHRLLSDPSVADWVLYRLDGRIDHVLVDEAQDTSPEQWRVIELLAQEFTAGEGARTDRQRTLFVVGDKKQSIYSFQGADAESFDRMRLHFADRLREMTPLAERELSYSFRSSGAILEVVDRTFSAAEVAGVELGGRHLAYHDALPGRVDLWPLVPEAETEEDGNWEDPVDRPSPRHALILLARGVAKNVRSMIDRGEPVPNRKGVFHPVTPGDVLILVQRRSGRPSLFDEIIRALKAERLPVAGADRLRLKDSLAVRDLEALLAFLALPEDDLSLATALRSPLFGWSEGELYRLAAGRGPRFLWQELRQRKDAFPATVAVLEDLRDTADILRPYDLLERILIRHGGRRKLMVRLGAEAEDGIDELLNLALVYERNDIPSLTGFLSWLEAEDTEIKRQLESAGGRIRVMTVHGSKGLEAPVVILPDTVRKPPQVRDQILFDADGRPFWTFGKNESPEHLNDVRDQRVAAETRERDRLLYVAMTRAQTWLIVCGAGKGEDGSWHSRVGNGMADLGTEAIDTPFGPGARFALGKWPPGVAPEAAAPGSPSPASLPRWLLDRAAAPAAPPKALSPSDLGGPKALPGDPAFADEDASLRRGRQIHRLLEHLPAYPEADWPATARAILAHGEDSEGPEVIDALLAEVVPILTSADLAHLFAPDTLAEVEITAALDELGGRRIHGAVDRLIVEPDRVLVVDFKSNAIVPEHPEETPLGLLRQMGAYVAALSLIYPGRRIEAAILWTRTARLMPMPNDIVIAALRSTSTS